MHTNICNVYAGMSCNCKPQPVVKVAVTVHTIFCSVYAGDRCNCTGR